MEPGLQQRFETQDACTIMKNLRDLFKEQARIERYETLISILQSKLEKGKPVGPHVFNMIGLFDKMARLGKPYDIEMATDIILHSLHDGFANFRQMFHMGAMDKTLNELHVMLKTAEQNVLVEPKKDVLMVNKGKGFKKGPQKKQQYQGKGKKFVQPKGNTPKVKVA